jgi:filamentous hemagglutinin family protein
VLAVLAPQGASAQHITIDGHLSPAQTLVGPNYLIGANLGKQVGSNLFHSFGQFNLANTPVPESATFTSTGSSGPISNVISRVTGGSQSNINGAIVSTIPGANLYLINPSGIVFGPHATVNVSGSFHASTADYLKMSDGAKFQATNPDGSTLSAASPAAFGFLMASPAQISVNGSTLGPVPGTLGLVGGPVSIAGATLSAPAGTIHVTSAASTGEVPVDPRNKSALMVTGLGPVTITGGSTLNVSDPVNLGSGGSVFIRSGALTIDASKINADNYGAGPGGVLLLRGDEQLALTDGANVHSFAQASGSGAAVILRSAIGGTLTADKSIVAVGSNSTGNSGKLVLRGDQVSLTNDAQLASTANSTGNGGAIAIKANNLLIDSSATVASTTMGAGFTDTNGNPIAAGVGGAIRITAAGDLTITNGGLILSNTEGAGAGGAITVSAASVAIDATNAPINPSTGNIAPTGIVSQTGVSNNAATSAGGAIGITVTGNLTITNGGLILSNAEKAGAGGAITVSAASVAIDATNAPVNPSTENIAPTGVVSRTGTSNNAASGAGGTIGITATGNLTMTNSGMILSDAEGSGAGGPIMLGASTVLLDSFSEVTSQTGVVNSSATGAGGAIRVRAGSLTIQNGATVLSDVEASGNGGAIHLSAATVLISGSYADILSAADFYTQNATGAGGNIKILAGSLTIQDGAMVQSATSTSSKGGAIELRAGSVLIDRAEISSEPFSAFNPSGTGAGGAISVHAASLTMQNRAQIVSETEDAGNGGAIDLRAENLLLDSGASVVSQTAGIVNPFASGSGGAITVSAGTLTVQHGAYISSVTAGPGAGGAIAVTATGPVVVDGGTQLVDGFTVQTNTQTGILAGTAGARLTDNLGNPVSAGAGGAITINAPGLTIQNGAQLLSYTHGDGEGGTIALGVAGPLRVLSGGLVLSDAEGSGAGGAITVSAGTVTIDGTNAPFNQFTGLTAQTGILSQSGVMFGYPNPSATANAGNVTVSTPGTLSISGEPNSPYLFCYAPCTVVGSQNFGSGVTGAVAIGAGALTIENGANILSYSGGAGAGGIALDVAGPLQVLSGGLVLSDAEGSGAGGAITVGAATATIDGTGAPPNALLTFETGSLITLQTGILSQSGVSNPSATANAGNVTINTRGMLSINGDPSSPSCNATCTMVGSVTLGTGNTGNVSVTAGAITITNAAVISSQTSAAGNSGDVSVNTSGMLSISGLGAAPRSATGIVVDSEPGSSGNAGKVTVTSAASSIVGGGSISSNSFGAGEGGSVSVSVGGQLTIDGMAANSPTGIEADSPGGIGNSGEVTVNAGSLTIIRNGEISSSTFGIGSGGSIAVAVAGQLMIDGTLANPNDPTGILSEVNPGSTGNGGNIRVSAGNLTIVNNGTISVGTAGSGNGGSVSVSVAGPLTIDAGNGILFTGITSDTEAGSTGNAGSVTVTAGALSLTNSDGEISSSTFGPGDGGAVTVNVRGLLSIDGSGSGIAAVAFPGSTGAAGSLRIAAGAISLTNGGEIATETAGTGAGGSVTVTTPGTLVLDGRGMANTFGIFASGIFASATGPQSGPGGSITVGAGELTVQGGAQIASTTAGPGNGGTVNVTAQGPLSLSDPGSGIIASATSTASGNAGSVAVGAPQMTVTSGAQIASTTAGTGAGGPVVVTTPGALVLDGMGVSGTQIAASATGAQSGAGGAVTVQAGRVSVQNGAQIASTASGLGTGGDVGVTVAGNVSLSGVAPDGTAGGISAAATPGSIGGAGRVILSAGGALSVSGGAEISSSTAGQGNGGTVTVSSQGPLSLSGGGGILALASAMASGGAGSVTVNAPQITVTSGAQIASTTAGTGSGGPVAVTTSGALVLDGMGVSGTEIAASAMGAQSGAGGNVTVSANSLTVEDGAQIASSTAGPGSGGSVQVSAQGPLMVSGAGSSITASASSIGNAGSVTASAPQITLVAGGAITSTTAGTGAGGSVDVTTPGSLVLDGMRVSGTQIAASATGAQSGAGGNVAVSANSLTVEDGAQIASSTAGPNSGGSVQVSVHGPLMVSNPGSSITASATSSGMAGAVTVSAPQITLVAGGAITTTTAGMSGGGSINVNTPGALVLDSEAQIAASATGAQSGPGGNVTVAANSLSVEGGAQIASSTAGAGKGGDVDVAVVSDIVLADSGPQITAQSKGSGDAGSVSVSAFRLFLGNRAVISTEAETSTANGGNITLKVGDFLYLLNSKISTSVMGQTGNGGNIMIDPQFVVLDHGSIIAQAVQGHGGNITIDAGEFIASSDSVVSASSQKGISGTVELIGPRVDLNGALTTLQSQLRAPVAVMSDSCGGLDKRLRSSLVPSGPVGVPRNPDSTLPSLYLGGRDRATRSAAVHDARPAGGRLRAAVDLTLPCE